MTAAVERFGWWWMDASSCWRPGSYAGNAPLAESDSRTTPPFALPHKRFVLPRVRDKAKAYLGSNRSYRQVVQQTGKSIVYDDRQKSALAQQGAALSHTTVWRWLSWLGGRLEKTIAAASKLIAEKDPGSTLHREAWALPPEKARSPEREATLQQAMRCLVVEHSFTSLFGKKIFPDLATVYRWS